MATFYDEWLAAGDRIQEEFRNSPMIAHDDAIPVQRGPKPAGWRRAIRHHFIDEKIAPREGSTMAEAEGNIIDLWPAVHLWG